jgi:exodeoxyribonuclease-5
MTQWSPQQDAALKAADDWYKNHRHKQQVFRIFGYAGSGKTTIARHFAQNISGNVKYACFTGKAAHVMASKGCVGATTIHRLIYIPKSSSKERLKSIEKELHELELQRGQPNSDVHINTINRVKEELRKEQENAGRMSFSLNLDSDLKQTSLLIIDEVSMVGSQMGKDLESFGVPILVLGDPGQLPPIYGQGHFTEQKPDILLTEIHRQALDNPIIAMSKIVREGKTLPLGDYGDSKVIANKLGDDDILSHDMILVGTRKAKKACDIKYRSLINMNSPLPMLGDRIMCIKNHHSIGLLNGQIWDSRSNAVDVGGGIISLHIRDEESDVEMAVAASEKLFYGTPLDKWEHEEDIEEFEYAYAITVHKAQGSQWDNVLLYDQKHKFPNWTDRDRNRWLYTGITRAAERITVMRL